MKESRVKIFGTADEDTLRQAVTCKADRFALMADNHLGYSQPIGGVAAYKNKISITGVGFDIACGNLAVKTDANASWVKDNISNIMDQIVDIISFGIGRKNKTPINAPVLHSPLFNEPFMQAIHEGKLQQLASEQLGTVGSGNHYVDIFESDKGEIWIGVHFGSRGLGHKITTAFLKRASAVDGIHAPPCLLDSNSQIGQEYLSAMHLAGEYAYAGREAVVEQVLKILGAKTLDSVHNHHNFAWKETHFGEEYYVIRKGATPAFPGQKGFVGGSMGDISVILEGVDSPEAKEALYSTVHGAGRVMGRVAAAGKWKKGKLIKPGLITRQMLTDWIGPMKVELRGAGCDEAPQCYKRLPEVLNAQGSTIKILTVLNPIGVAMAGGDEYDPYKD